MSLFYFNFRQGAAYSIDEEGCEFASFEDAYLGAVTAVQDMWRELMIRREDPMACAFEVTDKDGNDLFTLPFSEVLEACNVNVAAHSLPPTSQFIHSALEHHRAARRSISEVSSALQQTRATLRRTMELLVEVGKASGV